MTGEVVVYTVFQPMWDLPAHRSSAVTQQVLKQ